MTGDRFRSSPITNVIGRTRPEFRRVEAGFQFVRFCDRDPNESAPGRRMKNSHDHSQSPRDVVVDDDREKPGLIRAPGCTAQRKSFSMTAFW